MSLSEFLAWEERQELRYEFDGFQPVAMTGGTLGHDAITFNLRKALDAQLAGSKCRPFGPNVKILTGGRVRYPDAVISCTRQRPDATILESPVVVFEVVSESTSRTDRIEKVREYQNVPSIQRYIILEQDNVGATVFERKGNVWRAFTLIEGDMMHIPEIGIQLPLAECYMGVELPRHTERDARE